MVYKMKYKNCEIIRTNTTTDIQKKCFGHWYNTIAYVYEIIGEVKKDRGLRPFLTSIQESKDYINSKI